MYFTPLWIEMVNILNYLKLLCKAERGKHTLPVLPEQNKEQAGLLEWICHVSEACLTLFSGSLMRLLIKISA